MKDSQTMRKLARKLERKLSRSSPSGWGADGQRNTTQPSYGIRQPDKRRFSSGLPMELLRRRLGLDDPDPALKKLNLDKGKVHVLLAIHNKPQPAAQP